jgi:hypothetical protein
VKPSFNPSQLLKNVRLNSRTPEVLANKSELRHDTVQPGLLPSTDTVWCGTGHWMCATARRIYTVELRMSTGVALRQISDTFPTFLSSCLLQELPVCIAVSGQWKANHFSLSYAFRGGSVIPNDPIMTKDTSRWLSS